jgi:hypothetical protein
MDKDYAKKIEILQEKNRKNEIEKAQLEERLNNLKKEKVEIFEELKTYNINDKDTLEAEVSQLEKAIQTQIKELEEILND